MTSLTQPYRLADWLQRAGEIRTKARAIKDPEIRSEMETIARLYERLASWAERLRPGQPVGEE
jgi:hypothetical protein